MPQVLSSRRVVRRREGNLSLGMQSANDAFDLCWTIVWVEVNRSFSVLDRNDASRLSKYKHGNAGLSPVLRKVLARCDEPTNSRKLNHEFTFLQAASNMTGTTSDSEFPCTL